MKELGNLDLAPYDAVRHCSKNGYCNTDKLGRPIFIDYVKHLKAGEIFKSLTEDELILYYV